jgi:hypothetical protein
MARKAAQQEQALSGNSKSEVWAKVAKAPNGKTFSGLEEGSIIQVTLATGKRGIVNGTLAAPTPEEVEAHLAQGGQ